VQRPLQIGITGGIGSGKSTVCKIFNVLGVPSYDADSRAKAVMTTDGILMAAIEKEFGKLSFKPDGALDREYLSQVVFADEAKLNKLNALVHPRVAIDYEKWLATQSNKPYVLKEAALLFEAGSYTTLDKIIVVRAPQALKIKRILMRDKNRSEEQVKNIMNKQLPDKEKVKRADFVVENDEHHSLIDQVVKLHHRFLAATGNIHLDNQ
jgi:dephospho-CoA kinase